MADRFEAIAERYLKVVLRSGKEWMTACPFCESSDGLQFNIEKGLFICFGCETGGTAKSLVRRLGGTYSDPAVSVEFLRAAMDGLTIRQKERESGTHVLPESTLGRYRGPAHEHWTKKRGFDDSTIQRWELGYDPLKDRCTIPYRTPSGELLGVIERRLDDVFPRYLYPKGFDRGGSLFGSWKVADSEGGEVGLVEGSTDVIRLSQAGVPAVGQFGSSITPKQIRLLKTLGVRSVILFYDYDIAGRKAERQAREAINGILLKSVKWDKKKYCWHQKLCGCGEHDWRTLNKCQRKLLCDCGRIHNMDPGSLDLDEIQNMYLNAEPVGRIKWDTRRSAKSRSARKRRMGG